MMHRARRQRHRNRNRLLAASAIGEQQNRRAAAHQLDRLAPRSSSAVSRLHAGLKTQSSTASGRLPASIVLPPVQRLHLRQRQKRRLERQSRQPLLRAQNMRPRPQPRVQLDHARLAQRIDRRIRHLRKSLPEERVHRPRRPRQRRNRRVVAHRPDGVLALHRHRLQDHVHVFFGVAKAQLQPVHLRRIKRRHRRARIERRVLQQRLVLRRALRSNSACSSSSS